MAGVRIETRMGLPSEIGLSLLDDEPAQRGSDPPCLRQGPEIVGEDPIQRQNSTSGNRRNASSPVRNRAPIRRAAVYPIASAYDSFGRRTFTPMAPNNHP